VRVHGIQLGRVVDILLHPSDPRALGVDVLCGDDKHRFLPLPAARVEPGELAASSALVLLELRDDSFYRVEARPLSELRGLPVAGRSSLQDVVLGQDWTIEELVLDGSEGRERVPLDGIVLPARSGRRRLSTPPRRRRRPRRRPRSG
jgi:hypothetical protein